MRVKMQCAKGAVILPEAHLYTPPCRRAVPENADPRAQQQNETKVIAMEPGTLQQVGLAAPGDGRSPVAVFQMRPLTVAAQSKAPGWLANPNPLKFCNPFDDRLL